MVNVLTTVAALDYSHRVLREMDDLLERVRQFTVDVVERSQEPEALARLVQATRQSHSTFKLIECFGAELLCAELLALLDAMQRGVIDQKADTSSVLVLASEKLTEYVEYLKSGGQDLPLALLALVNNMRACRGVGLLSEALIVSPHFQVPIAIEYETVDAAAEKEFFNVVRRTRLPLMRDLVTWFKRPDEANMQPLVSAFENLQISSPTAEMSNLWAAGRALAVSIADQALESNAAVKMLLGQLERYLQKLDQQSRLQANPEFPTNLFKNLLYYVALSESNDTSVADLKKQFRLAELLPPRSSLDVARGALGGPGARLSEAICNSLGRELGEVKAVIDSLCGQVTVDQSQIDDALHRLRQVSYTLLLLGLNNARLLNDEAVEELAARREHGNYDDLQGIATNILRVDAALDEYLHGNGRPAVFAENFNASEATEDKLSSYQYNLIVERCLDEAVRSLQSVQTQYLAVLSDADTYGQLQDSAAVLDSVGSALQILPLPELKPLLSGASAYLRKVAEGESKISAWEQCSFAELMVCTELYLDSTLQPQAAAADLLMQADESLNKLFSGVHENDLGASFDNRVVSVPPHTERDMMAVFIDEALDGFCTINQQLALWKQSRTGQSLEHIMRQYHMLKGSGMMAGAATVAEFAQANEIMLETYIHNKKPSAAELEDLLNESNAVLPQLINQLSHPAQAGLTEIAGLPELITRLRTASGSLPRVTGLSSTSALDIFEQTIATGIYVDELSQTVSLQEQADMTSTVSMHDLGDSDYTRTLVLNPPQNTVESASRMAKTSATVAATTPDQPVVEQVWNDCDYTRTIALAERNEFAHTGSLAGEAGQNDDTSGYSLDNTLLRVFYSECLSHISLLKDMLTPSINDIAALPTLEMQRSLHTMRGSAHTADVPGVAMLVGPLEDVVNARLNEGVHFNSKEMVLVKDLVHALEMQVDALSEGRQVPAIVSEVEIRLDELVRKNRRSKKGDSASVDLQDLYIEEATELLSNIHSCVSHLRSGEQQPEHVSSLRAALHTLKGGARVAQFNAIADITHALEGALTRWTQELPLSKSRLDKLQEVVDAITVNLEQARTGGSLGQFDGLISELNADEKGSSGNDPKPVATELVKPTPWIPAAQSQHNFGSAKQPTDVSRDGVANSAENLYDATTLPMMDTTSNLGVELSADAPGNWIGGDGGSSASTVSGADLVRMDSAAIARLSELSTEVSIHQARVGDYFNDLRDSLIDLDKTTDRLRYKLRDLQKETDSTLLFLESTLDLDSIGVSDATARLEPADLERYTQRREDSRQLSEILADFDAIRAKLHHRMRGSQESLTLTSRIGSDIQQSLLRSQLVSFNQHSQRLASTIRQTAAALDKSVDWELVGGDCSIDRSLHKALLVPLEHLIRNAIAHGIEPSTQREEQGKPACGKIQVGVRFDGNDLVLSITDDGAGVDFAAVRERLDNKLDDQGVLDALFKSGFTTVTEPNQYAGRGVGLDVVERTLAGLNGGVSIQSVTGEGTTVSLRIAQRVVIHQVVLVELDDAVFGIPVNNVHTVVAVKDEEPVSFNGHVYTSHRLADLLGHNPLARGRGYADKLANQAILIEAGGQRVALRVNDVPGYRELIARPLGQQVSSLNIYTGGSILSNGRSVLILDLNRLLSDVALRQPQSRPVSDDPTAAATDILVVDDSVTMRTYAERILATRGYSTVFARDGIEALERLKEYTPDLILLDIEMPRMDGFELLEKLRANDALRDLPVVIVSSRSSMKHRRRASELGVQSYMVKPYREEELLRLMDRMSDITTA